MTESAGYGRTASNPKEPRPRLSCSRKSHPIVGIVPGTRLSYLSGRESDRRVAISRPPNRHNAQDECGHSGAPTVQACSRTGRPAALLIVPSLVMACRSSSVSPPRGRRCLGFSTPGALRRRSHDGVIAAAGAGVRTVGDLVPHAPPAAFRPRCPWPGLRGPVCRRRRLCRSGCQS